MTPISVWEKLNEVLDGVRDVPVGEALAHLARCTNNSASQIDNS